MKIISKWLSDVMDSLSTMEYFSYLSVWMARKSHLLVLKMGSLLRMSLILKSAAFACDQIYRPNRLLMVGAPPKKL